MTAPKPDETSTKIKVLKSFSAFYDSESDGQAYW